MTTKKQSQKRFEGWAVHYASGHIGIYTHHQPEGSIHVREVRPEDKELQQRHAALVEAAKQAQHCLRRAISLYEPDNLTQQSHVKHWSITDDKLTKALEASDE